MTKRKNRLKPKIILYCVLAFLVVGLSVTGLMLSGIMPHPRPVLKLNDQMTDSEFYNDISSGAHVCFIGDSITHGNANGGVPWYAPIEDYIPGQIDNISGSGYFAPHIIGVLDTIPDADVYVIAIGTNDCRDPNITTDYYVKCLEIIHGSLSSRCPDAHFYYIAPWTFCNADQDTAEHCDSFASALESFCNNTGSGFINSTPYILDKLKPFPFFCMTDNLHPDSYRGVMLYSEAVLMTAQ